MHYDFLFNWVTDIYRPESGQTQKKMKYLLLSAFCVVISHYSKRYLLVILLDIIWFRFQEKPASLPSLLKLLQNKLASPQIREISNPHF